MRGGLKDISVSRLKKSVGWAIPVPGDDNHTVYVWIDALTNYLTALGGPNAVAAGGDAGATWAASHHLIAKDILRFHAVYWPAMLKSAGLPPPGGVFCHGYLTVKGQKISKSMPATRVDPMLIADDLGVDPLRYFVLREYTLGGDGDFTYEALLQRYESELGNDLGNLLNRTVSMARQFLTNAEVRAHEFKGGKHDTPSEPSKEFVRVMVNGAKEHWKRFAPSQALDATWELVRSANRYIDKHKPWELAKGTSAEKDLHDVLAACCAILRITAHLIAPAMPDTARRILKQIDIPTDKAEAIWRNPDECFTWPGGRMQEPEPLFPRVLPRLGPDKDAKKQELIAKWLPPDSVVPPPVVTSAPTVPAATSTAVTSASATAVDAGAIEKAAFDRVELRAARVLACERVPKTDKLLKLTLDIGTEHRTVVSGIAGAYDPEALVGRTVVYLANLKPAKIRGVVSQGMILAAGDANVLALCALDRDVPPGTRIR